MEVRTQKKLLVEGFKKWLETMGYAENTVYAFPLQLREYLEWLEINQLEINQQTAVQFMEHFKLRKNKRRGGGLSIAHINKQVDVLNKFFYYLLKTNRISIEIRLQREQKTELSDRKILTEAEVLQLYEATENDLLGKRDRAMLAVYYGCGLRKKEGLELLTEDVLFERKLLYVRHPKNGYERYVPINQKCLADLSDYLLNARPFLLGNDEANHALFISSRGRKMSKETMVHRLKRLSQKTNINHTFGLHTLRHSIATHLLKGGMSLENIALFLGHRSLDSTQIYTHISHERSE
jgi:integrase/recombinase XerD